MRLINFIFTALILIAFAGCSDASGGVSGNGTERASVGRVHVGMPF